MFKFTLIFVVSLIAVSVLWRLSSQRWVIPCPSWLAWMIELDNPLAPVHKAQAIVKNLNLKPGMTVLDVGCGPGRVTIPLAQAVGSSGHVVGLDLQQEMIDKAQRKADQLNLKNLLFIQGSFDQMTLEGNAYDRVLMVAMIGEVPDQEKVMQQAFHVLKPGGILSVSELIFDPHFQSKTTIRNRAYAAGFKEVQDLGPWYAYTLNFIKS